MQIMRRRLGLSYVLKGFSYGYARAEKGRVTRGKGANLEIDIERYIQFISHKDITILTRQLATLIGASVPMAEVWVP